MLLCSYVVESSTCERRYQATDGWKTRIIWLQQAKTISDQIFESCMFYAKDDLQTFITSRRGPGLHKSASTAIEGSSGAPDPHGPSAFLQLVTMSGTAVALCGFVLQFIGLRGMHWSASVAQLGAVLVMVVVKAWVRRGLARSAAASEILPSGFELDSFVKRLGVIDQENWSGARSSDDDIIDEKTRSDDWIVVTGGKSSLNTLKYTQPGQTSHIVAGETSSLAPPKQTRPSASSLEDGRLFDAQTVMEAHKLLSRLADWRGHASVEARSLARAVECTMDNLRECFHEDIQDATEIVWYLETCYMGSQAEKISINLLRDEAEWKVDASVLDATLSLWLSSAPEAKSGVKTSTRSSGHTKGDEEWPRSEGTAKQSLTLLGYQTPSLARDLQWWVPRHPLSTLIQPFFSRFSKHRRVGFIQRNGEEPYTVKHFNLTDNGFDDDRRLEADSDSDGNTEDPNYDNFVSYHSNPAEACGCDGSNSASSSDSAVDEGGDQENESDQMLLGTVSHQSVKSLYAMDLYSSFMRAVAKAMVKKIPGEAERKTSDNADETSWRVFSLRNSHLSKMIQDVHNTGLGSLDQIYLSIITPLSVENKLPGVSAVVNLALQKSKQNEQSQRWQQAGDDLIWLSRLANTTFKPQSPVVEEAAANLIEYLRLIDRILKWKTPCDSDSSSSFGISTYNLQRLHSKLQKELRNFDLSLREPIETKAAMVGLMQANSYPDAHEEAQDLLFEKHGTHMDPRDVLHRTAAHYAALTDHEFLMNEMLHTKHQIDTQDLLGRTAMHYACLSNSRQSLGIVHLLLSYGADLNFRARDGATPLHYAAMTGKQGVVEALVEAGATVDSADLSGGSPLHTAAVHGHVPVVQYLWGKVKRDLRGQSGWTVLQLVAVRGKEEVAQFLVEVKADQKTKDRSGSTALHLAVEAENLSVLKVLLKGQPDLEAEDHFDRTALCLAVDAEHHKMVECLIEAGANRDAEGYLWRPIELAVRRGYEAIVHLLLKDGYDCHGKNRNGDNLLHVASLQPNTNLVREFLKRGVDVNSKGDADMSPLHYAAICGILSNGRLLLQRGANTEQVDAKGWTPLWYATRNGDAKFVQVLLYRGSSIERSPDIFGRTIFHYAKESRNERVLQLLQRHLQQNQTTVASPPNSSPGASSNTDSHAGPSLSSGGLSTGDEV